MTDQTIETRAIETRARFDIVRYAQGWEDADVLVKAMSASGSTVSTKTGENSGSEAWITKEKSTNSRKSFLSVAAAGDNVLALLLLNPEKIVAADLSQAQLYCLQLRIAAFKNLSYDDFIELMEGKPSQRRCAIATELISHLDEQSRLFWSDKISHIGSVGLGGIGKFERYFAIFRRYILPIIASKRLSNKLFEKMDKTAREEFFDKKWDSWRWRLATKLFFSNTVMGKLGRDPAFFDYVDGKLAQQVRNKVRHAVIDLEPHQNPYMQWILLGYHKYALPMSWRKENYQFIRDRVDRIECFKGPIQEAPGIFDGFNLSDIFEYMSPSLSQEVYSRLLEKAAPDARIVYWNMMVKRKLSENFKGKVRPVDELAKKLKFEDKAFFYSDLVIEDVIS